MARKFLTNIDLNLNQLLNSLAHMLGSDPGSPAEGQFWYNSTGKVLKFRNDAATVTLGRLDQISAPTAAVNFNSQQITGLADGSADSHAATVGQLNAAVRGFDWKASVRAATTAAGTLASDFENGDTIDGVTLATGDRILIKNQAAGAENGIYTVNASGAPTRATDADASAEVTAGLTVYVESGTVNADTAWTITNDGTITLGTTALVFTKTFSATAPSGTVNKYSASVGNGSATSFNVDHNLGSLDVIVQVFTNADGTQVEPDVTHSTTNRVVLDFAVAPTSNQYRVVVLG